MTRILDGMILDYRSSRPHWKQEADAAVDLLLKLGAVHRRDKYAAYRGR